MKKIIVTPAGRKEFLEILYNNINKKQNQFDKWILWANTDNEEDLAYIKHLSDTNDFIEHIDLDVPFDNNFSISSFFKYCVDPDAMYLRLDDDICYIHDNAIENIFNYRAVNPEPFLIYGNIVNNAYINNIQKNNKRYPDVIGETSDNALEYIEKNTSGVAIKIHKFFMNLSLQNKINSLLFKESHTLSDYSRVSINAISWFGKDFAAFNGIPDFTGQRHPFEIDEEEFLSCTMPRRLSRPNVIYGEALFVHFSFNPHLHIIKSKMPRLLKFYLNLSK